MKPKYLEQVRQILSEHPGTSFSYSDLWYECARRGISLKANEWNQIRLYMKERPEEFTMTGSKNTARWSLK